MVWRGGELAQSRFTPAAIAVTHLFSVGFMSMVMIGALQQMLPVLAGAPIRQPRLAAGITHICLTLGTLGLAGGLLFDQTALLKTGVIGLGCGFMVLLIAVGLALLHARTRGAAVNAIWIAVLSLLATVTMGAILGSSLGWGIPLLAALLVDLHPGWGLLGWTGLLATGIAFHAIPMLQSTPAYPAWMVRWFVPLAFVLLLTWSVASALPPHTGQTGRTACQVALASMYVAFAAVTIDLLQRRRRRLPDVSVDFWRVGMASLLAANIVWLAGIVAPVDWRVSVDLSIGVLAFFGFAGSIINGMLYKIVPFLAWFHGQARAGAGKAVPNMRVLLGQERQRLQFRIHLVTLALLVCASAWQPQFVLPAGLALGLDATLLAINVLGVASAFEALGAPA